MYITKHMQNNVYRLYSLEVKSTNKNRYISDRIMQKCIYNRFMSIDRERLANLLIKCIYIPVNKPHAK